ncbi:MAG: hypothetical protein EOP83_12050 [Verrucomicrobiaceae bacterium]|nr:MAG: hypothetical protein EOP83_12050 [Verrucomicrobiaceae bacterium]
MDRAKPFPLSVGDPTGLHLLGLSVFLTLVNSGSFMIGVAIPVAPIPREALPVNIIAAAIAWIAFIRGRRQRIPLQLAASVLLSVINFVLYSNLWAVFGFGL